MRMKNMRDAGVITRNPVVFMVRGINSRAEARSGGKWMLLLLCLVLSSIVLPVEPARGEGGVRNSGFEKLDADDVDPAEWGWVKKRDFAPKVEVVRDAAQAHSGSNCIRVTTDDKHAMTLYGSSDAQLRGKEVCMSAWVRGSGKFYFSLGLRAKNREWIGHLNGDWFQAGPKWKEYRWTFKIPERCEYKGEQREVYTNPPRIRILGDLYFDDVQLRLAGEEAAAVSYLDTGRSLPLLTIPKLSAPPKIDGRIGKDEWQGAAAVTGFRVLTGEIAKRQTLVYFGFDDKCLYFAFRSGYEGVLGEGDSKHDFEMTARMDLIEIWLDPGAGEHFQFVGCPAGGVWDRSSTRGVAWNGQWRFACDVETSEFLVGGTWEAEAAVAFDQLGVERPKDGDTWGMNFCRDWRDPAGRERSTRDWTTFCRLTGSFGDTKHFARVRFGGAAIRLKRLGDLQSGSIDVLAEAAGKGRVGFELRVGSSDGGKVMVSERRNMSLSEGRPAEFSVATVLKLTRSLEAELALAARDLDRDVSLFQVSVPFKCLSTLRVLCKPVFVHHFVDVDVDLSHVAGLPAKFDAVMELCPENAQTPVASARISDLRPDHLKTTGRMDLSKVKPGRYDLRVKVRDEHGRVISSAFEALTVPPKPEWLGNKIGLTDEIPPPWKPIESLPGNRLKVAVSEYDLADSGLPRAITAKGEALFASPPSLRAVVEGKPVEWRFKPIETLERKPGEISYRISGSGGKLRCEGTLRVEYDGFALWDVKFSAPAGTSLDALWLEFPLIADRALYARAVNRLQFNRCYASLYNPPSKNVVQFRFDRYNAGGWVWPDEFFSAVWIGDDARGFSIACDTDQYLFGKRRIEIENGEGRRTFRVHLVSAPVRMDSPLSYKYSWQSTPVRPEPKDPKWWHACYLATALPPGLLRRISVGASYGLVTYVCYPEMRLPANNTRRRDHVHKYCAKIVPDWYFSACCAESPEFKLYGYEWRSGPFTQWGGIHGKGIGSCCRSSHFDYHLWSLKKIYEELGFAGLYLDVSQPIPCRNQYHGCGYRKPGDDTVHPEINIFRLRELYKRAYTYLKTGGRDGVLFRHGMRDAPAAGFCDVVTQGEEWLTEGTRQYTRLTPDLFRAKEMRIQYGVPYTWYSSHYYAWRAKRYGTPATLNEILALCLPHRVMPTIKDPEIWPVWDMLDEWWTSAEFVPYWSAGSPAKSTPDNVLTTAYVKRGEKRALLVIANWNYKAVNARVELDLAKLGLQGGKIKLSDAMSKEPVPLKGSSIEFELPRRDLRMLVIEPAEDGP